MMNNATRKILIAGAAIVVGSTIGLVKDDVVSSLKKEIEDRKRKKWKAMTDKTINNVAGRLAYYAGEPGVTPRDVLVEYTNELEFLKILQSQKPF